VDRAGAFVARKFRPQIDALPAEVVAGSKKGRTAATDRIIAIVQGMAIADVAFAAYALHEAEKHAAASRRASLG